MVSGRTRTASRSPPRRSATVSAAPIEADEGQRRRAREQGQRDRAGRLRLEVEQEAQERRGDDQRQAGGEPMRERLGGDRELERHARRQDQVERAVLVIHGDQPVEREQVREQRAEPQDGRARSAPAARGRGRSRTAPASPRSGRTARRSVRRRRRARRAACRAAECGEARRRTAAASSGGCVSPKPQSRLAARVEPDRSMGGGQDQPAAGEMRAHELGQHRLRRGVERGGRLVEQPDRPLDRDQAGEREAAALPGGEVAARAAGRVRRGRRPRAPRRPLPSPPPRKCAQKARFSSHRQRRLEGVLVAEIVGLLADGQLRIAALELKPSAQPAGPGPRPGEAARTCPRRSGR